MQIPKLGWKRDPRDSRDWLYAAHFPAVELTVTEATLADWTTRIEDQWRTSSCTGFATSSAIEIGNKRKGLPLTQLSPRFAYWGGRFVDGFEKEDAGAHIRSVMKWTTMNGICTESLCPTNERTINTKPSVNAFRDARLRLTGKYYRIDTLQQIKQSIVGEKPVVFGFDCFESLFSNETTRTGIIPMPRAGEPIVGGHAVCAASFSDRTRLVGVVNSWSRNVGDNGWYYLPYDYFLNGLTDDHWIVT